MLTVSVIIPTYNYARYLPRAIDSVLSQSAPPAEVIVVDDGSTDGTEAALAPYRHLVHVIRQPNQGVSAARNRGAARASGDLIAFLDADDYWHRAKLECQLVPLEHDPAVSLVHCGVEDVNPEGQCLDRHLDGCHGWVADDLLLLKSAILCGSSGAVIRRKLFSAVGGFDKRLSTSADWDLWWRLALEGPVAFVEQALFCYTLHDRNMHYDVSAMERDMLLSLGKYFSGPGAARRGRFYRQCHGNCHMMLAGSYWAAGDRAAALHHLRRSIGYRPSKIVHVINRVAARGR
jgi:glycosyltransferase involved in cell wall biosynthesis